MMPVKKPSRVASVKNPDFRLSSAIRPHRYQVWLSIDWIRRLFTGRMELAIEIGERTDALILHAAGLQLTSATLIFRKGSFTPRRITPSAISETVTLHFGQALPKEKATLSLQWSGAFNPGLRGLYGKGDVAVTQFEAADARRVFPCFDEPSFKAQWKLHLRVPRGLTALANGAQVAEKRDGDFRWVEFDETPPISSYLVALAVGTLKASPTRKVGKIPLRTWAVPEKVGLTRYAQNVAAEVLPRLEQYFGVPYAYRKVDQVGVPEFEAGAMENVGLITFRESALLLDPGSAALTTQKRVAEVVTHELAHQWYGNLVTMAWWDDLWLNEAFATWMAAKVVDGWRPEWRVWLDFDASRAAAMDLDALRSTHPVRAEVRNAQQAGESFDVITYEKGGAVLRMIESYLGEEIFRDGIRGYIRKHAGGNTTAQDLWRALERASRKRGARSVPVRKLAEGWIDQGGFPVVSLERTGSRLSLSQRRFVTGRKPSRGGATDPVWPVPLVIKFSDERGVREQRVLFQKASETFTLESQGEVGWVLANAGAAGFYRVAYSPADLERLATHLAVLLPSERVQLLADLWAGVRAGNTPVAALMDLAAHLSQEQDYAVLDELVARLGSLERDYVDEADRDGFRDFVERLLRPGMDEVGWDSAQNEPDVVKLRRSALVRGLGGVARADSVVEEGRARLLRFMDGDRTALAPDLHGAATSMSAREGSPALFKRLLDQSKREKDPAYQRTYLLSTALFEAPDLAARAQSIAFAASVPTQDFAFYVSTLLSNPTAREQFWKRLRDDWATVRTRAGGPALMRRVIQGIGHLPERRNLEEATRFLKSQSHALSEAQQMIAQTLERMEQSVALRERLKPELRGWLAGHSS